MSDFLNRIATYSPKRLALLAHELKQRVDALEDAAHEPIAIVGMACRFPGGADTPDLFWNLVRAGGDAISETPADRWDVEAFYDPDPDAPGKLTSRYGGFLSRIDEFDPDVFGIARREAQAMDPQQRLLLEVTWQALENAGIAPDSLAGAPAGVFMGLSSFDYFNLMRADLGALNAYSASGAAHSIASGRLAYVLGTRGPALSIDTACSSSLVATHLAVQSLRVRQCDLALGGGVNVILSPETTIALSKARMMSPDGRCKAFDARADGFVRGEGCGVVVLKRLRDAIAARDPIVAVIRGSACNQDGRSNGLTAPSGAAQEALLRAALADARVEASAIGYVETHGTGTKLGDPIEALSLDSVYREGREAGQNLFIGSVKANIGHLEAAAGVAGVIKMALAVSKGVIPRQPHFETPNPHIPWNDLRLTVPREEAPWPASGAPRLGSVSSFGFSGTNAHLVLEQAPAAAPAGMARPLHIITASARTDATLDEIATSYASTLSTPGAVLSDAAHMANAGRATFARRAAVVADSPAAAAQALEALAHGQTIAGAKRGVASAHPPKVAFLFTGQGAQYLGMGMALYAAHPEFRATLDLCDKHLRGIWGDVSLLDVLQSDAERLADTTYTQVALFSVEYALARLWMSWGVRPAVVMGHSLGELTAACVAEMLSLEEALTLVAARGRLMGGLPRDGAMAAVMAGEAQVAEAVASFGRGVSIAAINGPLNTVVSGPEREVDALCASLGASGVVTTRLNVSHAFHSQLMDPILDAFLEEARRVSWRKPQIEIISNTTGAAIGAEAMRPEYWRTHARAPVRFADSIRALVQSGCKSFVEIGPHPTLLAMAQSCAPDADLLCLPSLKRGAADYQSILTSLSALFVAGAEIDWESFDRPFGPTPTQLATYPFHRERLWVDTAPKPRSATPPAVHPLLGWEVRQSLTDDRLFETRLGPAIQPYLADHRIQGALVAPSPVFMEMMVAAGRRVHGDIPLRLQHFELPQALLLSDDAPTTVQTSISPSGAVKIAAIDGDGWRAVASAEIDRDTDETIDAVDLEALRARLPDRLSADAYYTMLTGLGVALGPRFCGISDLWRKDGEALAQITPPEGVAGKGALALHPALLDACLQAMGAALPNAATLLSPFVLVSVDRVRIFQRVGAARLWAHASIRSGGGAEGRALVGDMRIYDEDGAVVALVDGAVFLPWRPRSNAANARVGEMLYEVKWKPARILPLDEIEAALAPEVDAIVEGGALTAYESFAEQLDELSALYVIAALRRLGWSLAQGSIATRDLADRLGVLPRHARLFARMLAILAEDGVLEPSGDAWRVVAAPPVVDPEAFADRLLAAHPDCAAELVLTRRCGAALADVLRGEADPLTLLFPGGSLADTERLYQSSPPARFYNQLVAEAVGAIAGAAGGRPLRILEVGAGTGSTTTYVLGKLAGRAYEYTFTDVSPLFLNRAREKFAGQPGMRYATFDLERDPGEQGFAPGEYDIIIAANVVHATRDLALSCSRLRSLLTSEGRLVLLEGATPQRFGDLTVGMLEGWWAFVDTQRRQYALISREAWSGVLKEAGFSDTVAVPPTGRTPVLDTQAVLIAAPQTSAPRRWLIAPDRNGMADRLADALRKTGRSVTILDPLSMTAQVRDAKGAIGVVLLTALDRSAKADAADLASGQRDFFTPALGLVRALAERAGPARLYIATCGAQATTAGERVEPTQASAWGFSHVVALEHPELGCTRVDLDPGADPAAAAAALADELCADAREDQVAFRNGARLVRRLVRRGPGLRVDLKPGIAESGAYLVTGGLRGLGLLVGEWLVDQGARHIVLMGRNAPGEPASQAIARMTERGARVVACRGDVSVREDVHRVVSEIGATGTPLAGVFHCAGVLDDGVLISQTWERFAPVLAPKVQGAWNLHEACGDAPLVLFASGASISGSGGQSNHAAANAFEDALAWMRQAEGKPSVSINWGPWAQVGAAADRTISATILKPISNADGLEALSMCLARAVDGLFETSQLAVFDADWSSISGQAGARLFSEMAGEIGRSRRSDKSSRSEGPDSSWRARVLSSPADRQLAVLREEVRALVGSVLGATPASIDVDEPLRDLGLDSLMAVELRNRLGKATETTLPATVAFDYPTVQAMVDFLAAQRVFGLDPAAGQTGGGEAHSGEADRYQGQTEAELAAELIARLDRLKV